MNDIDLTTVPLAALTAEIKRRMEEFESAKQALGFGTVRGAPGKSPKNPKGSGSRAALKRWAGWKEYKAQHPNANRKEFFRLKKAGKL